MPRDLEYEESHIAYDEQYPEAEGGGIQCKNYKVCGAVLPKWWWDCKGQYLCTNCDMLFGELTFKAEIECLICFDYKQGVSQLKCDHFTCTDCFKRCYYGDEDADNEPQFPYPEIEEDYYNDPDNIKWKAYPFIHLYHEEWEKWDDARLEKYENEKHLRKCPLCRK